MMKKLLVLLVLINLGYYFLIMDHGSDGTDSLPLITRGDKNTPLLVRVNEVGKAPTGSSPVPLEIDVATLQMMKKKVVPPHQDRGVSQSDSNKVEAISPDENQGKNGPDSDARERADTTKSEAEAGNLTEQGSNTEPESKEAGRLSPEKPQCYTIGPFRDKSIQKKVAGRLSKAGAKVEARSNTKKIIGGWWVYLPPYESREAAREASRVLAENNVSDYLIITNDDAMQNAISLGLFSKQDGSERRIDAIESLGFKPRVQRREREIETWWLDVVENKPLKESVWKISDVTKETKKKSLNCPS